MKRLSSSSLSWLVIAVVVISALVFGTVDHGAPRTVEQRERALAETLKCPTCRSQSVADSDAAAARAIRVEIARRVTLGQTDAEIRAAIADRYGEEILLTPSASGLTALVWILPVAALVLALGGLVIVLRRWSRSDGVTASVDDEALVAQARGMSDDLDALTEERDFLLASLDDLEAEHSAGDISDEDYAALHDDYTVRAARSIRALDAGDVRAAAPPKPRRSRTLIVAVSLVVFAAIAGFGVAQSSGRRSANEPATGDIRQSSRAKLNECISGEGVGDPVTILKCYDSILTTDPDNVGALTYRGWYVTRQGLGSGPAGVVLVKKGLEYLDHAVEVDDEYSDARVFRAVAYAKLGRVDDALAELDAFDALDPPPDAQNLADGLRRELEQKKQGSGK